MSRRGGGLAVSPLLIVRGARLRMNHAGDPPVDVDLGEHPARQSLHPAEDAGRDIGRGLHRGLLLVNRTRAVSQGGHPVFIARIWRRRL